MSWRCSSELLPYIAPELTYRHAALDGILDEAEILIPESSWPQSRIKSTTGFALHSSPESWF